MSNPHPFYRFYKTWNAGFYPDNQIMSDLLNEIRNDLVSYVALLPYTGKTINQWYAMIKQFVKVYEQEPYFGQFDFTIQKISDIPNWEYNINIFNPDLTATTPGQVVTVNGFFNNSTQQVVNASVNAFTPGSFTPFGVDYTLVNDEVKAREALRIVDMNGSAIFPLTYSFNPNTNVATSFLSRARDLQLVDGVVSRFPADNLPYQNQRLFQFPQLNGDDTYVISIMERIIQASIWNDDYTTSILATYTQYATIGIDGWTFSISNPVYVTYERVQINIVDATRRKFILVGRKDGSWLWQRFVSDYYNNAPYNFLTAYTETTLLPFPLNQAGRWQYNDDTFDLEFVEFTSGCYVSDEFYPMPAKPGDQFQFNVWDANLLGIDSALVGLFEQDGTFIQQIGTASLPLQNYTALGMYGISAVRADFTDWYDGVYDPEVEMYFQFVDCSGNLIGDPLVTIPDGAITSNDFNDFKTLIEGLAWPDYISVVVTQNDDGTVDFDFTFTSLPECICGVIGYQNTEIFDIKNEPYYQLATPKQHQASVTIPSKQGCYRMGLYNEPTITPPSGTCELTFTYFLSEWLASANTMNEDYPGEFFTFALFDGTNYTQVYQCPTPFPIAPIDLITTLIAFAETIPGMVVENVTEPIFDTTFTWTVTVDCGNDYRMQAGVTDEDDNWNYLLLATEYQPCECDPGGETCFELYSLSNIINIDASDCYSTILEFWANSDSLAESFEYFNGWKQRIRLGINGGGEKPIFEESQYRQSNGVHRRPQNKQDLSVDLHTDFLDIDTQLALVDATRHPYLIWEGKSIFVRGDVEVATIQDFTNQSSFETLAQVKFQALIQGFQPGNSSCLTC